MNVIDVIVPVYADATKTRACLESVIQAGLSDIAELQIIYDCGPDVDLERYLDTLSTRHDKVHVHKNECNLGFVKTVNRGFSLNPERDVIILNSDTLVYNDWITRIINVASNDERIATVTPFSNNAEICSFPRFCTDNKLPEDISGAWLDAQFSQQSWAEPCELPTGVGFCMWIRRAALNAVGLFDEATFGRGYGEENDFCRRAVRAGYTNVLAPTVFVYHEGGVSFGAEKSDLIDRAVAKVEKKHPGYVKSVHEFIRADPLRLTRAGVMNAILRNGDKPLVLAVTHNLAGGTKQYLDDLINTKMREFDTLIIQPVSENRVRLILPQWMGESYEFDLREQYDLLKNFLSNLGLSLIFINHVKGIESCAARLVEDLQAEVWCVLHDYYFIFGNPTLTDTHGKFMLSSDNSALSAEEFFPAELVACGWQSTVHKVLLSSAKVVAPSESVRRIYRRFFPKLNIVVYPHRDEKARGGYESIPVAPGKNSNAVVVIGALNKEKGADLLESVAQLAKTRYPSLRFHLLGYAYRPLAPSVITSGPYQEAELSTMLRQVDPALVWYPCQWPETYSYTLSRVLEAGYPLLIPDLGALADRTLGRPLTRILSYPRTDQQWLDAIADSISELGRVEEPLVQWSSHQVKPEFYMVPWTLPERLRRVEGDSVGVLRCLVAVDLPEVRREWLLRLLFRFRQLPVLRSLAGLVPIHRQRQIKRLLSSKPVHDIVR